MPEYSVRELREKLDNKDMTTLEVTESYLSRINDTEKDLNSFITVTEEHARQRAQHAQKEIDNGNQGALTGIPYAAKDLFCTKDITTTSGSRILQEYIPPYSATVIEHCRDGVLLGKTNMDEFAMGSSTEHSGYGPTKNPYDLTRVPGGSSGGSASSVAAGQAPFALGTDTGGSIRLPAAFCNVVGFKPTYGRISRYGAIAMASSLDTVGTFTRNVEDAAFLLNELAGQDPLDTTTPAAPVEDYTERLGSGVKNLRVGIPKEYLETEGLDPKIRSLYEESLTLLEKQGAKITEVSLPHTHYALATYYVLSPSEVSSNLARYDGIQYGTPSKQAKTLDDVFMKTREEGLGAEAKLRSMVGAFCLSSGYYDAYYKKAQRVRTLVRKDFEMAFETVDVLFTPTAPFVPFPLGDKNDDPIAMLLADIFTVPASLAGIPAVSIPGGAVDGLPVGVQIIGSQFQESQLLQVAHALESEIGEIDLSLAI